MVAGYNNFLSGTPFNTSVPVSLDTIAVALDVIAIGAVLVLTTLSLILSRGLNGTGLRRGFALKRIERYRAEEGVCPNRRRGICSDYRKLNTVRSRPWIYELQTAPEYLLRDSGPVPCPIGLGGPELLPSLVQIVQR